ncbi:hypothetical protein M405DRAFT_814493 [Rhizopogon salebrosus TDB-379]|nr:hypothetical protein M405DRAFT_814493 [Rhizopogon salebrosus TDB-379]
MWHPLSSKRYACVLSFPYSLAPPQVNCSSSYGRVKASCYTRHRSQASERKPYSTLHDVVIFIPHPLSRILSLFAPSPASAPTGA